MQHKSNPFQLGAAILLAGALTGLVRAVLIGAAIGLLAWYLPLMVGTGASLTQEVIKGGFPLSTLAVFLLIRFLIGPFSIAAGTPGGYFTPVLALGALIGAFYGSLLSTWLPTADISSSAFALAGMGVALATVARAPFTGILLTMETTGAFSMLLPMTIAVIVGAVVTHWLGSPSLGHGLERLREHFDNLMAEPAGIKKNKCEKRAEYWVNQLLKTTFYKRKYED